MNTRIDTIETIETVAVNLLTYVPPQEYVDLWWGAYLGSSYPVYRALRGLYRLLISSHDMVAGIEPVTLGDLSGIAGQGREKTAASLRHLAAESVVAVHVTGTGRETAYQFDILAAMPVLTPKQVSFMPRRLTNAHSANLSLLGFLPAWHSIEAASLAPLGAMVRVP